MICRIGCASVEVRADVVPKRLLQDVQLKRERFDVGGVSRFVMHWEDECDV